MGSTPATSNGGQVTQRVVDFARNPALPLDVDSPGHPGEEAGNSGESHYPYYLETSWKAKFLLNHDTQELATLASSGIRQIPCIGSSRVSF